MAVLLAYAVQCIVVNAEEMADVQELEIDGTGTEEAKSDKLPDGEPEVVPEDMIYQVSFPADIHAFLDPGDLSGKGQVFSSRYAVENYGNTDIDIVISGIDVYYSSEEDVYEFSEEPVTDYHGRAKKMNIDMVWENESEQAETVLHISEGIQREYVLSLKASEYDDKNEFVGLCDGSSGGFYFTGTLNGNPDLVWEEGEIIVRFDYEILSRQECVQNEGVPDSKMNEIPREDVGPEENPEKEDSIGPENTGTAEKEENPENTDKTAEAAEDSKKEEQSPSDGSDSPEKEENQTEVPGEDTETAEKEENPKNTDKAEEETEDSKKETEDQEPSGENKEDIQNGEQQEVPDDMEDMTDHENCAEKTGSEQDQTAGEDT